MNASNIKELLEKYWNCDSSLEDEQQLRNYFANGEVAPEFLEHSDLFSVIGSESKISINLSFPSEATLRIHELMDKYWDCTTDLDEEVELKAYFSSGDVDKSLANYTDLFTVLDAERKIKAGKIAIDRKMEVPVKESSNTAKTFSISKKWIGVAASLLLVAALWFNTDVIKPQSNTAFAEYAVEDEDEALEVTMEALAFLSGKLDKSTNKIKKDIKRVGNASLLK